MLLDTEPKYDFVVRVVELPNAGYISLYEGIYEVSLNNRVCLSFLPPLTEDELKFNFTVKKKVVSRYDALMEVIRTSKYCVIPDDKQSGITLKEPDHSLEEDGVASILFYRPVSNWEAWKQEFERYHEHQFVFASELESFSFMEFISEFIHSPYIDAEDLKAIGR